MNTPPARKPTAISQRYGSSTMPPTISAAESQNSAVAMVADAALP